MHAVRCVVTASDGSRVCRVALGYNGPAPAHLGALCGEVHGSIGPAVSCARLRSACRACALVRVMSRARRAAPCRELGDGAAAMDSTMVVSSQGSFGEGKGAMVGRAAAVDWPMQLSIEATPAGHPVSTGECEYSRGALGVP